MAYSPPSAPEMSDKPPPYEVASGGDISFQTKEESVPLAGGYPPQLSGQGYPPQYDPQYGYPPQDGSSQNYHGYPPQGPGYPPQGPGYPQGPSYLHQSGYPPQAGSHAPQTRSQPPTTVIVQQPTTLVYQTFRETPVQTVCQSCQASIITGISYETGTFTWLVCAILCLIGCEAGCCLIPFCVDGCKDAVHVCPNCRRIVGRYNRL